MTPSTRRPTGGRGDWTSTSVRCSKISAAIDFRKRRGISISSMSTQISAAMTPTRPGLHSTDSGARSMTGSITSLPRANRLAGPMAVMASSGESTTNRAHRSNVCGRRESCHRRRRTSSPSTRMVSTRPTDRGDRVLAEASAGACRLSAVRSHAVGRAARSLADG
jgi:hypothetical protein